MKHKRKTYLTPRANKFVITKPNGMSATQAFLLCEKVAGYGLVSRTSHGEQHCFHTSFNSGSDVSVRKTRAGVEHWTITRTV